MSMRIGVLGSHGFIGGAVVRALKRKGVNVHAIRTRRIASPARSSMSILEAVGRHDLLQSELGQALSGCDGVVNAAGVSSSGAVSSNSLFGANAVLPGVIAKAAAAAGVARMVHVSSAATQGRRAVLDESLETDPFSPYTLSKTLGELSVRHSATNLETSIYRPTSVHGAGRGLTRDLLRLARSPLATVAGDGSRPTPQVLVENVADGIATVATLRGAVPEVVLQPAEGWTCETFLHMLSGGRPVRHVPDAVGGPLLSAGYRLGRRLPAICSTVRRVEMLWYGQAQMASQLSAWGWRPPVGPERWTELLRECR